MLSSEEMLTGVAALMSISQVKLEIEHKYIWLAADNLSVEGQVD